MIGMHANCLVRFVTVSVGINIISGAIWCKQAQVNFSLATKLHEPFLVFDFFACQTCQVDNNSSLTVPKAQLFVKSVIKVLHSPAIWLSNHLYSNFKIWLYCLNKLFKISVLKIVINERRSQTSITHGAKFYCIFKLISAQPQGMFPHNPKLHYQEKMMGTLSSTIIMYAVPC